MGSRVGSDHSLHRCHYLCCWEEWEEDSNCQNLKHTRREASLDTLQKHKLYNNLKSNISTSCDMLGFGDVGKNK